MNAKQQEAIKRLDAITGDDPKIAHIEADGIILLLVPIDVVKAYMRVAERCDWWASA